MCGAEVMCRQLSMSGVWDRGNVYTVEYLKCVGQR